MYPRSLRSLLWLGALLLLGSQVALAEAFVIRNYSIDIQLNSDGSFEVVEKLTVDFTEARRGIIRSIPVRYAVWNTGGEQAIREHDQGVYEILLREIDVPGDPFQVFDEGDYVNIRIGDPDVTIEGRKEYEIRYRVWGALNQFQDRVEFSWNLIGTEWATSIDQVQFRLRFPKAVDLSRDDVILYTGQRGAQEQQATFDLDRQAIQGQTRGRLEAYEGVSLALRFPNGYFDSVEAPTRVYANRFFVAEHQAVVQVNRNASLSVEETYLVDFVQPTDAFTRAIFHFPQKDGRGLEMYPYLEIDAVWTDGPRGNELQYQITRGQSGDQLRIEPRQGLFSGRRRFTLRYTVWGAVAPDGEVAHLKWDLLDTGQGEPVEQSSFQLRLAGGTAFDPEKVAYVTGSLHEFSNMDHRFEPATATLSGKTIRRLLLGDNYGIFLSLDGHWFDFSSLPFEVYARNFSVADFRTDLYLERNGTARIQHRLQTDFVYGFSPNDFQPYVRTRYRPPLWSIETLPDPALPDWSLLSPVYRPLIFDLQCGDEGPCDARHERNRILLAPSGPGAFGYEYRAYGLLRENGDRYELQFPALYDLGDLVRGGSFRIHFPEAIDSAEVELMASTTDGTRLPTAKWATYLSGELPGYLLPGDQVMIDLSFPKSYLPGSSWGLFLQLLWKNNAWLAIPLLLGSFLYLLWYFFGRDPKVVLMTRYTPPPDLTPAEAGFLRDEKLHKKDLVSLIYYWAAQGLLHITELDNDRKSDYQLTKVKDLPPTAKDFEKVMFSGLFKGRSTVTVSSLRDSFYTTMKKAHAKLEAYGKARQFFVPGTRGFGAVLIALGVVTLIAALVLLAVGYFIDDYSYSAGLFLATVALLVFGWLMPKKGPFGTAKYAEILGFREFVRTAEIDRLKVLVDENPHYFEETIAYAIVFGLGERWAEKFKDLITEPPEWYDGRNPHHSFSTVLFADNMMSSMHRMNRDLNYQAPSQSSWSGGGGSSFGGGFSSGGGFGGGGGSSW